ncbi:sigma-70 family RNA polymerase sigma factor [Reyranella sp. CPCC 100927]|uniref:sigma-70 family RNA polymerase sigma factor n=1 Tax=Reyranella sp. CPCC 100927 TaxID=2599616 RepID=UPI0011B6ADD0|nr:sigma-70 family RNA polymerase sigma factor [Reyranella sp. CPCC 100927]TWT14889.1 sigma-70 family RNA polymerase sigma factor [Reyranella sp. CPCC 100927]
MSTAEAKTTNFHAELKNILPRLRVYALSLTRDRDRADDLVQETVVKALAGQNSFRPGTCFSAWVFRIQRNEFISGLRRQRPTVPLDETIYNALSHPAQQDRGLIMQEFLSAFGKLSVGQREALVLAVIDGQSYDQIARHAGVSVGTIKSRISRARDMLERLLVGQDGITVDAPETDTAVAQAPSDAARDHPLATSTPAADVLNAARS